LRGPGSLARKARRPPLSAGRADALSVAVLAVAGALAIASLVIVTLSRRASRLPSDVPNDRSLHQRPVPRGGGIAIWAGCAPAALLAPPDVPGPWPLWLACLATVAAVSFADDARGLPVALRLGVHAAAAGAVAWMLAGGATWQVVPLALAIAWGANLFNFMDGSDGVAAVMTITGFAAYAAAAALGGAPWALPTAIAFATMPFFVANRPPASMFMGDVGAVPLGFLAAALGVAGVVRGTWPAWFPLVVFAPFVLDATLTLARRALRGERVWRAHRTHYYQRLHALGAGHRGTLAVYGAAMLACALAAVACLHAFPAHGWSLLAVVVAAHLTGFAAIDYHWARTTT
jgi:UDP-N-acetylmuramyl pentapeptide phosphotransferase/UDP-N-acetylglucosamine-1-phosphate transferase